MREGIPSEYQREGLEYDLYMSRPEVKAVVEKLNEAPVKDSIKAECLSELNELAMVYDSVEGYRE